MKRVINLISLAVLTANLFAQSTPVEITPREQRTQLHYLSRRGCDDMVQWDVQCTDGRNAGKWSKIGVPSCWELQSFGTYQY